MKAGRFLFLLVFMFGSAALVQAQNSMILYHNDLLRTGLNSNETLLAPSNVNSTDFGKLFTQSVDGQVYGQPLYVPNLSIAGGTHNVVYVVTEHDSVYAFDADTSQAALWHVSFLNAGAGVTTVAQADVGNCPQITTEIGITDTPAIDLSSNTIYMVAMTKQVAGAVTNFYQTLHALDLSTGVEKLGGPSTLQASVAGTGDGGSTDTFNARSYKMRSGLVIYNGVVYTCSTSHCDFNTWGTYHGWLIGYDASAVTQQVGVFNVTPNGSEGAIWSVGDSLSVDPSGGLYFETGNGTFDAGTGGKDYGDSIIRLAGSGTANLAVTDYFTPANQASLSSSDQDLGSVGQMLLPDSAGSAAHPHLLTGGDKTGEVYLLDRDNLGGYQQGAGGTDKVVQEFHAATGSSNQCFTVPAYYNGFIYWSMVGQTIKAYGFTGGQYNTTASSQTLETYANPGCVPSLSSNGNTNGILWAVQPGNPAVLRAYDATNLGTELYNSAQTVARDSTGSANNKFTPPTIINGKVYVPTSNSLVVYGLLITATPYPTPTAPATPTPTGSPTSTPTASATATRTSSPTATASSTPTSTPTWTASSTPTSSPTSALTASATASQTPTASLTSTRTPSSTPSGTPTLSPTSTASFTATESPALTPTSTLSATPTLTASFTPSPTGTVPPSGTPTSTPTPSPSRTPTSTATTTDSATATSTPTATPSPIPSATATSTVLSTPALTPAGSGIVELYPNPSYGGEPVSIQLGLASVSDVHLKLFTVSYRKVRDQAFRQVQPGQAIPLDMHDQWGHLLARGIYYVWLSSPRGVSILKLLVL